MANFLDRLAGQALGIVPVAQPIVPPITSAVTSLDALNAGAEDPNNVDRSTTEPKKASFLDIPEAALHPSLPSPDDVPAARHPLTVDNLATALGQTASHSSPTEPVAPAFPAMTTLTARAPVEPAKPGSSEGEHKAESEAVVKVWSETRVVRGEPALGRVAPRITPMAASLLRGNQDPVPPNGRIRSHDTQSAPVIRVTIGRVDVRAQFTPGATPPPPPRHKGAAPLSLADYAKQRSEGRR